MSINADLESKLPPISWRTFWLVFSAGIVIRLLIVATRGYEADVASYEKWSLYLGQNGVSQAYSKQLVDYPPFFVYPLWFIGKLYSSIFPVKAKQLLDFYMLEYSFGMTPPPAPFLTAIIKTPQFMADLLITWLLYHLVCFKGYWGRSLDRRGLGRTAALLYFVNPAVLWMFHYGQPDSIHTSLALVAVVLLPFDAFFWVGTFLTAACLMKPLAVPLVPLISWTVALRGRAIGLLFLSGGSLFLVSLLLIPFALEGNLGTVLSRIFTDIDRMPYASANATNLWFLAGMNGLSADTNLMGSLTPRGLGLSLFFILYVILLSKATQLLKKGRLPCGSLGACLCFLSASVSAIFFLLSTHMHENHMFMSIPFLVAVAGRSRQLILLATAASLAVLFNCILLDPWIWGFPNYFEGIAPEILMHPRLNWVAPWRQDYSWFQIAGSYINSLLVTFVAISSIVLVLFPGKGNFLRDKG